MGVGTGGGCVARWEGGGVGFGFGFGVVAARWTGGAGLLLHRGGGGTVTAGGLRDPRDCVLPEVPTYNTDKRLEVSYSVWSSSRLYKTPQTMTYTTNLSPHLYSTYQSTH